MCPACRNYKPHYEKVARLFNEPDAIHPRIVLMTRVDCAMKSRRIPSSVTENPQAVLKGARHMFLVKGGSFFVEKKKVAVILDKNRGESYLTRNIAYIIGKQGYFKQVDLGESTEASC